MKKALINLHIAVFLAGFTGVLGKLISLNESLLVWYRLLITVITMGVLFMVQRSFPLVRIKSLFRLLLIGSIVAFHWVAFYGSVKYANVSIALVCFSTVGFFSALLEPMLLKTKASYSELALGMLAVFGVYLIFHFDTRFQTGILFGIISAILAAVFTILNKKAVEKMDAGTVTFYELTGGFVMLTLLLPGYLRLFNQPFTLPARADWLWLLVLSWLCTVLAFYLSLTALKRISSFTVNLTYNLEPLYGILLAFIIFRENKDLGMGFYLGLLLILLAVVLQMSRVFAGSRKRSTTVDPQPLNVLGQKQSVRDAGSKPTP